MKKIGLLVILLLLVLAACNDDGDVGGDVWQGVVPELPVGDAGGEGDDEDDTMLLDGTMFEQLLEAPASALQLSPLTPGEELMVMHTNYGDITLRFFPEEAPLAVETFVTHARNGFYDGLVFHRVIEGFMIQGGCPIGTGAGGESIWGGGFGLERSFNLRHFRGALATAHAGPGGTIGSQFYIVQSSEIGADMANQFRFLTAVQDEVVGEFSGGRQIYMRDIHPPYALAHYMEYGGTPHLDWHWNDYGHTVFGHVVEGMDVVDLIAETEVVASRPVEDVVIERISFVIYGE
jgi:peptidyl-prolyl cis-trans isomerase B (cyclophilin B)